ncbi:MAG: CPBP family intramembrane metalloprotease [Sedimentisphaerales bacterium]|nr:CPBP family intramembrane metalloprotease [Sedimentisphaerales bacterium]
MVQRFCFFNEGVSINDTLVFIISPLITKIVILILPFCAAKLFPAYACFDYTWIRRPRTKIRWYVLLTGLSLFVFLAMGALSKYTGIPQLPPLQFKDISQLTVGFFVCAGFITTFLNPVYEEVFWRGYTQDQFTKCFGQRIALFLQAFLFALCHMRPVMGFWSVFFHGLIWGFWRHKRRSLVPIIITHMLVNGLYALATYPDLYELSRVKKSIDYVQELNRIGNTLPAEENAAPYYQKAWELLIYPPQEIESIIKKCTDPNELDAEQEKNVSLWITQNTEAITQLKQGTQKNFYWPTYVGPTMMDITFHEEFPKISAITKALCWNARLLAKINDMEAAFGELLSCWRFGNHLMQGPKPLSTQIWGMGIKRNACKVGFLLIHDTEISKEQFRRFLLQFEHLLQEESPSCDLTCEKLTIYDNIQRLFTDDGNGNGHVPRLLLRGIKEDPKKLYQILAPGLTKEQIEAWGRSQRKETTELIDRFFASYDDTFRKSPAQLNKDGGMIDNTTQEMLNNNIMYIYLPDLSKMHSIFYENKAFESAFVTTLAIFCYKQTCHSFPENLQTLISEGYMSSLPLDPYSGNSLIYRKTEDSFILYSIGKDFEDNGGIHDDKWGNPTGDYVFWPTAAIK